jgi:hypothetical protein
MAVMVLTVNKTFAFDIDFLWILDSYSEQGLDLTMPVASLCYLYSWRWFKSMNFLF